MDIFSLLSLTTKFTDGRSICYLLHVDRQIASKLSPRLLLGILEMDSLIEYLAVVSPESPNAECYGLASALT